MNQEPWKVSTKNGLDSCSAELFRNHCTSHDVMGYETSARLRFEHPQAALASGGRETNR